MLALGFAAAYVQAGTAAVALLERGHPRLPVPGRRPAGLPGSRRRARAARPTARRLPGRAALGAAAHARPARPDDRAPQRRGRPLLARDRGRRRAFRPRSRSWCTRPVCCTTSASSSSRTTSSSPGAGALSDEEWEAIKAHPYEGARIVSQIDGYQPIGEIILAHHERIDGKGYPRGLSERGDPRAGEDRLGRRHLRRDDRPRHLPRAGELLRGGRRAASRLRHPARPPLRRGPRRACSRARTSPTATARTPTSRPSLRSTSASTTTLKRRRQSATAPARQSP